MFCIFKVSSYYKKFVVNYEWNEDKPSNAVHEETWNGRDKTALTLKKSLVMGWNIGVHPAWFVVNPHKFIMNGLGTYLVKPPGRRDRRATAPSASPAVPRHPGARSWCRRRRHHPHHTRWTNRQTFKFVYLKISNRINTIEYHLLSNMTTTYYIILLFIFIRNN